MRKQFLNPKVEVKVFSYIICSLDFKNVSCTLFLLHMLVYPHRYVYSLFIAYWGRFVVCIAIGSPSLISFYCACFVSFYFFYFFLSFFCEFYYLLKYWGKFGQSSVKAVELFLGSYVFQGLSCYSFI